MSEAPSNALRHLSVLLNHALAPKILQTLRDSQTKQNQGQRFTDILAAFGDSNKKGRVSMTLSALESAKLVERQGRDGKALLSITADGLNAIAKYEELANDPGYDQYPDVAKELLRRHGYPFLLLPQREFISRFFPLKRNQIVEASPSAGKTLIAEFCILDALRRGERVLYATPYKALNHQKFDIFSRVFNEYKVAKTDGDTFVPMQELGEAKLIVATYERALAGILQNESWLHDVSFVVADEISLLKEVERGSNLDLLLSLLKERCSVLTLSSHIGNIEAVKEWLGADVFEVPPDDMPQEYVVTGDRGRIKIGNTFGSQKTQYVGLSWMEAILKHSELEGDGTMIVLVGNRPEAERLARRITEFFPKKPGRPDVIVGDSAEEETPVLKRLNRCLERGVAFHHAGLPTEVRYAVESLLDKRSINIVVSTPTLSHGVDFPLDHVVIDLDSFSFRNHIGKIDYIQYRGRAARVGRSRGGKVYVHSAQAGSEEKTRQFLQKPVEEVYPPNLDLGYIEWLTLLACDPNGSLEDAVLERCHGVARSLLAVRNPRYQIGDSALKQLAVDSLKALQSMRFLSSAHKIVMTEWGRAASKVDWTPPDARRVIETLEGIRKRKDLPTESIGNHLLFTVCYVGLLKNFDSTRISDIVITYRRSLIKAGKELPPRDAVKGLAVMRVLRQWMEEAKIKDVIRNSASPDLVQDEDVRKLASYAGIEMRKVAIIAGKLGYSELSRIAEVLSVRLKKGVKEDLVNPNPSISLFRLDDIGRVRARTLYKFGFRSLLDVYSAIFNKGEDFFVKKSHIPAEVARAALERLRSLAQSDETLQVLCSKI
jgi:ATP-dependent DNA helicase